VAENRMGLQPGQVRADESELLIGAGVDALRIIEIQRAGSRRMTVAEFLRAQHIQSS